MRSIFKIISIIFLFTACSKIDIRVSDDEILKQNNQLQDVAQTTINTTIQQTTSEPTEVKKADKPIIEGFSQYINKDTGFKIQCPSTYSRFDKLNLDMESNKNLLITEIGKDAYEQIIQSMNNTASVWYDFESTDNNYPDNITLIISKMPSLDASFIKFEDFQKMLTDNFVKQYNKSDIKTKALSEGILLDVSDNKFVVFHYLQKVRDIDFSYYQVFTTSKGYIYHLTFTNKQDRFNQDLINKILSTVEIN